MRAMIDPASALRVKPRPSLQSAALLFLIVWLLPAGCGLTQVRVGFSGGSTPDGMAYRFETFSATESAEVSVDAGQRLTVSYDAVVDKGVLTVHVLGPDGIVREAVLDESATGSLAMTAEESGVYTVTLRGEDAGGSIDVSWQVSGSTP